MKRFIKTSLVALVLILSLALSSCSLFNPASLINSLISNTETDSESFTETETEPADTESLTETEKEETNALEKGVYLYEGVQVTLPEDFILYEEDGQALAVPPSYPMHTDNINFTKANDKIDQYTPENLKLAFEAALGAKVNNFKIEKTKIDGRDCAIIRYTFDLNNVECEQCQYSIFFSDKSVHITFTDTTGEFEEELTACAKSIKVVG